MRPLARENEPLCARGEERQSLRAIGQAEQSVRASARQGQPLRSRAEHGQSMRAGRSGAIGREEPVRSLEVIAPGASR